MPNGRGKHKSRDKKRTSRTSKGLNKHSKHPLNEVEKALLGKGVVARAPEVDAKSPWKGTFFVSNPPFNPAQVEENRRLYPHLFQEE